MSSVSALDCRSIQGLQTEAHRGTTKNVLAFFVRQSHYAFSALPLHSMRRRKTQRFQTNSAAKRHSTFFKRRLTPKRLGNPRTPTEALTLLQHRKRCGI